MNEIQTYPMDAECKHCGHTWGKHSPHTNRCPRQGNTFFAPETTMEIKCKHCGHAYGKHAHYMLKCPDGSEFLDDQFFAPVTAKDETYVESIAKISDSMSFLVRELQDAHGAAPGVAAEMLLLGWLEQIVKIKTGLIRLKAETKGR